MSAADDIALLDAWRAGDKQAGNALLARHFQALLRFFENKVGADADELIQRTLLACAESHRQFRGDASFRTYLFTVARHELYAHYERRARAANNEDIGSRSIADLATSPSGIVARRREHDLLLRALRAIALDFQVALELHFWEGMSGPEMAEVLGLAEGTVRSRIRRAKEALEEKMKELAAVGDEAALEASLSDLDGWARTVRKAIEDR